MVEAETQSLLNQILPQSGVMSKGSERIFCVSLLHEVDHPFNPFFALQDAKDFLQVRLNPPKVAELENNMKAFDCPLVYHDKER